MDIIIKLRYLINILIKKFVTVLKSRIIIIVYQNKLNWKNQILFVFRS